MIRTSKTRALLLVPSWSTFVLIFVAPVLYFLVISFWRVVAFKMQPAFTFTNYTEAVERFYVSILFTFSIAMVVAVAVVVLAFLFCYYLRFKAAQAENFLLFVALVTLFGGYLTKIYVWKTILGENGVLNTALLGLNVIDQPIRLFLYNPGAVIITLVHYTLPLAILPIYGALRGIEDTPITAARDLGAGPWRTVRDIILPQAKTSLIFAFALTYLFVAGDYVTPQLVGGAYTSMIGLLIQMQFGFQFNAPLGAALTFIMVTLAVLTIGLVHLALSRWLKVPDDTL